MLRGEGLPQARSLVTLGDPSVQRMNTTSIDMRGKGSGREKGWWVQNLIVAEWLMRRGEGLRAILSR